MNRVVRTTVISGFLESALHSVGGFYYRGLTRFPYLDIDATRDESGGLSFLAVEEDHLQSLDQADRAILISQLEELTQAGTLILLLFPKTRVESMLWKKEEFDFLEQIKKLKSVLILNTSVLSLLSERPTLSDQYRYLTNTPLSPDFFNLLTQWLGHLAAFFDGTQKKLLLVDLDQTLWCGVLAEDDSAESGEGLDAETQSYEALRQEFKHAKSLGYLLALVTHNFEYDVKNFLDHGGLHPLHAEDFVSIFAGWQPKPAMVSSLLENLKLSAADAIFIDDNDHENNLMKNHFPEITILKLPKNPFLRPGFLRRSLGIENPFVNDFDLIRTATYHANAKRQHIIHRSENSSTTPWIQSLNAVLTIPLLEPNVWHRVSQLANRTNQFNFHPHNRKGRSWQAECGEKNLLALPFSYSDILGEDGIVAMVVLRFSAEECTVEDFFLSCRAFGRGIEWAILRHVSELAEKEALPLIFEFHESSRNKIATNFIESLAPDWLTPVRFSLSDYSRKLIESAVKIPITAELSSGQR